MGVMDSSRGTEGMRVVGAGQGCFAGDWEWMLVAVRGSGSAVGSELGGPGPATSAEFLTTDSSTAPL